MDALLSRSLLHYLGLVRETPAITLTTWTGILPGTALPAGGTMPEPTTILIASQDGRPLLVTMLGPGSQEMLERIPAANVSLREHGPTLIEARSSTVLDRPARPFPGWLEAQTRRRALAVRTTSQPSSCRTAKRAIPVRTTRRPRPSPQRKVVWLSHAA